MTQKRITSRDERPTLGERAMLWISSGKNMDGIWVGTETNAERIVPRLEEALELIKMHDLQRYNRLARDLNRVWARLLTSGVGQFNPRLWACMVDERFAQADTTDAPLLAAVIVHEATHARLWRYGFGYNEDQRERIEAICLRRELAFARRLPDGQKATQSAQDLLASPPTYLTNTAQRDRHVEGSVEALRYLGFSWLTPMLLAIRKWRSNRGPKGEGPTKSPD